MVKNGNLAVKKLSPLVRGMTSNHKEDFYCLNCFSLKQYIEKKLKKHYDVCKNHDYCYVEMTKENKILKYNHGEKSMKVPFIIFADLESLLKKMGTCHNNPEISSTAKINKHTPSGYSLLRHCSFDLRKK